jgi:hypothetical protein
VDHAALLAELLIQHGFRRHEMARNRVGHLQLVGQLGGRTIDILVDTGAASTVIDLNYCKERQISVRDTGRIGGGAGGVTLPIHALGDVTLALDGSPLRSDGIFAIDMSHVNQGLVMKGANRVHAVLGADVLLYHRAVINYATRSLFLKHESG